MTKNWLWARDEMKSARDKYTGKPVMLNTYIKVSRRSPRGAGHWDAEDAVYACVYHGTEVVRYYPDGTVEASCAGWPTVTTKRRISELSPLTLSTERDMVFASVIGSDWPGDAYTWFTWKDDRIWLPDGSPVPGIIPTVLKKAVPKRRDPLTSPREGDAFRDSGGAWIFVNGTLRAYAGDHPLDRHLAVAGSVPDKDMPTGIGLLSLAGGRSVLTPINRFLWEATTRRK